MEEQIDKLINGYVTLKLPLESEVLYVSAREWIPGHIFEQSISRQEARLELIRKFMKLDFQILKDFRPDYPTHFPMPKSGRAELFRICVKVFSVG